MNKVDKKIFEMAKNERIEVPKTYEEKVQKILDELPENQVEGKHKLKNRLTFVIAAILVLIMSIAVGATINVISKRMNDMSKKEKKQLVVDKDKSNAEKDSYSRKLTDSEWERMDVLREQYEKEGRFPEGKLSVVDNEGDAIEGQITFVTTTRTYVIPKEEMTDEQILQIIDYGYKEDYSLRQEHRGTQENYDENVSNEQLAENDKKIINRNEMTKEEVIELAAEYAKNIYDIDTSKYDVEANVNEDSGYEIHFQKNNSIIVNIDAKNKKLEYIHNDTYENENTDQKVDENLFKECAKSVKKNIVEEAKIADVDSKYHYEYTLTENKKVQAGIMSYYFEKSNGEVVQIRFNCKEKKIIDVAIYTEKQYKTKSKIREKQYKEIGLKRVSVEIN